MPDHPFVGRGGLKLEAALDHFGVDPAGRVILDVGASTGGFTDCLLRRGARFSHAVDVGHNQLDWRLRNDPRVRSLEGTHIRDLEPAALEPAPDLAVVDVSFIGLAKVIPHLARFATLGAAIVLVKPNFELATSVATTISSAPLLSCSITRSRNGWFMSPLSAAARATASSCCIFGVRSARRDAMVEPQRRVIPPPTTATTR